MISVDSGCHQFSSAIKRYSADLALHFYNIVELTMGDLEAVWLNGQGFWS